MNESITLTITATDDAGRTGTYEMTLQVVADSQPPAPQPDPESPPVEIPSSLTLGLTRPFGQQREIQETLALTVTDASQYTGFTLTSNVDDLFTVARRDSDKAFHVYSRGSDGDFTLDGRFVVRENGNLSVKKGVRLDFESEDNPNGLIELQIIFVHNDVLKAKQDVSLQLTSQNESPVGEIKLIKIVPDGDNVSIGDQFVPVNTNLGIDLSDISDPDGDILSYKFSWHSGTLGFVSRQATYTPESPSRYNVTVTISDGSVEIRKTLKFSIPTVPESGQSSGQTSGQTSGQGGGRAMTEVVSYDDFSPDAGMEELGAPLAEVL